MGKIIRNILVSIFTVAFIPAIGEFFVKWAEQNDFYSDPNARIGGFVRMITESPFYWPFVAFAGGMLVGALAHHIASMFDRRSLLNLENAGKKLEEIEIELSKIDAAIWSRERVVQMDEIERWVNRTMSLELNLNRMGLETPHIDFSADPVGFIARMRRYASRMAPLLRDGHKWHAIAEAQKVSKSIRQEHPAISNAVVQTLPHPDTATEKQP